MSGLRCSVAAAGGGASSGPARTMAAIQQEMSEQMAVIMDQDAGMAVQWGPVKCKYYHASSRVRLPQPNKCRVQGTGRGRMRTSSTRS
jgi:hypothetical protein